MRGRPRKHAKKHHLDGTYRPDRHDDRADGVAVVGKCEPTRKLNAVGKKEFDRVLAAYPAGTLGASDSEALTQYAEWVQRMDAIVAKERSGELPINATMKLAGDASKHCLHFAVRFGLTPADRGKVKLSGATDGDGKEKKFFGPRAA